GRPAVPGAARPLFPAPAGAGLPRDAPGSAGPAQGEAVDQVGNQAAQPASAPAVVLSPHPPAPSPTRGEGEDEGRTAPRWRRALRPRYALHCGVPQPAYPGAFMPEAILLQATVAPNSGQAFEVARGQRLRV